MKTVDELTSAFAVYYSEMDRCEKAGAYWALLHLTLVLPDICAALLACLTSVSTASFLSAASSGRQAR